MNFPGHNVIPIRRDRDEIVADLRAGLGALSRIGDELNERDVSPSDIGALDSVLRGVGRVLVELRVALDPPRECA